MKHLPLFLLLLSFSAFGQNKFTNPRGFESVMEMSAPTNMQMEDTIRAVVRGYCRLNKDSCEMLLDHTLSITKNLKNRSIYGHALLLAANHEVRDGRDSSGFAKYAAAAEIFKKANDSTLLVICDSETGSMLLKKGEYKKAAEKLISAIAIGKTLKNERLLLPALGTLAIVYSSMEELDKAEKMFDEVIELAEKYSNTISLVNALVNKGTITEIGGDNYRKIADSDTTNNILLYRDSANIFYNKALTLAERALAESEKVNHAGLIIGSINLTVSLLSSLERFKEAEELSMYGMPIAERSNDKVGTLRLKTLLGAAQYKQGFLKKALNNVKPTVELANELNLPNELLFSNELLSKIYNGLGDYKNAAVKLEEVYEYQKKESSLNAKKAIAEVEIKYETSEKEKQILQLEIKNDKIQKQRNYIMTGGLLFSLFGFFGYRYNKIQKERNDKKEFAEALIFAQEEERKRIARDLHDGVGQSLLLIKKQLIATTEVTMENQRMITDTLEEVRSISRDLHPFQLDKSGLTATIQDTILKVEESTTLFISKEIQDIDGVLPPKSEIHLYRTIQEALSNIVKHSGATAAKVSIENLSDKIKVSVLDNGKGFDVELAVVTSKSLGLRTMHERISSIGGRLKIEKGEQNGTRISITIPK